jgi:hypothetical protein
MTQNWIDCERAAVYFTCPNAQVQLEQCRRVSVGTLDPLSLNQMVTPSPLGCVLSDRFSSKTVASSLLYSGGAVQNRLPEQKGEILSVGWFASLLLAELWNTDAVQALVLLNIMGELCHCWVLWTAACVA